MKTSRILSAGLGLAMACVIVAPAQALEFTDVIPAAYAAGFDVATPDPDWNMSTDPADFLFASPNPAHTDVAITFEVSSNCFLWAGVSECQAEVPDGQTDYSGVTTWTVTGINIPVPTDGLLLFIGGIGNADYVPPTSSDPSAPDYQQGDVQLLTGGGDFGGSDLPLLKEILLPLGPGFDRSYYGEVVTAVGDTMSFGYRVNQQHPDGTPLLFVNVANNAMPVPEPGTALLVGTGLVLLAARRKRS